MRFLYECDKSDTYHTCDILLGVRRIRAALAPLLGDDDAAVDRDGDVDEGGILAEAQFQEEGRDSAPGGVTGACLAWVQEGRPRGIAQT